MMRITWRQLDWLICYALGTLMVLGGAAFGRAFVIDSPLPREILGRVQPEPLLHALVHWDGAWYRQIVEHGYSYDPMRQSSVHFFPLYPMLATAVHRVTGVSPEAGLLAVSHLSWAVALWLLAAYTDLRFGKLDPAVRTATLLAACLLPAGLFFRTAYSESLFLLLCLLTLYLMERRVGPFLIAMVGGLASAARPVGIALLVPILAYAVRSSRTRWQCAGRACGCVLLSTAGLLGFMAYCYATFGDPLAFAYNMALWHMQPSPTLGDKLVYLESFQPVWSIFSSSSPAYWGRFIRSDQVWFTLYAANPVYFLFTLVLLLVGIRKRWLNLYENLMAWGLLLIPYWLTAYEVQMAGMARYVSVITPLYLVLGRLLAKVCWPISLGLLGFGSFLLAAHAALFARWYWLV